MIGGRRFLIAFLLASVCITACYAAEPASLDVWSPPTGTPANKTWSVEVRAKGNPRWTPLFVYAVKIGHQGGDEPLSKSVGLRFRGAVTTSLATFDFSGEVEIRAVFKRGRLERWTLSPASYQIPTRVEENAIYFSMIQDVAAPRKIVIRPNDDWEHDCLHLLTNPVDVAIPQETDKHVYAVEAGAEIPRSLPDGKTVYFFKPGIHRLTRGAWVELDLGEITVINRFDLISGPIQKFTVPGGQNYRIEYREQKGDPWLIAAEDMRNAVVDLRGIPFPAVKAQFVRLILLGNTTSNRSDGFNVLHSNHVRAFRLYGPNSDRDCAEGKAIAGSPAGFARVTTAGNTIPFGSVWSGESFFIPSNDITLYLSPGAIVKGAIAAEGLRNVTIRGRGILDASELVHEPASLYREGRTSAIRCEDMTTVVVEGIKVLDSPMWSIVLNKSKGAVARNLDVFGSVINADGIHMSAVRGGLVQGCFVRSTDDLFCMYHYGPGKQVTVQDSVFWSDGGRIFLLGLADTAGDIEDVHVENIDVLNVQNVWSMEEHGGALHICATGGNAIQNVRFKNIRIEPFRFPPIAAVLQIKANSKPFGAGKVSEVIIERMDYEGSGEYRSYIAGASNEHTVSGIGFTNCRWGQRPVTANHPQLDIRPFTSRITFLK